MGKHTGDNETPGLISLFINRALNYPNEPDKVKIVLPDECGDSLWDDVLNQEIKACDIKSRTEK
jgi:hypothetical protein